MDEFLITPQQMDEWLSKLDPTKPLIPINFVERDSCPTCPLEYAVLRLTGRVILCSNRHYTTHLEFKKWEIELPEWAVKFIAEVDNKCIVWVNMTAGGCLLILRSVMNDLNNNERMI